MKPEKAIPAAAMYLAGSEQHFRGPGLGHLGIPLRRRVRRGFPVNGAV